MVGGGSKSAKGGPNPLADMDRGGPNPLADLDRGVQIRGGSKSAVTPAHLWVMRETRQGRKSDPAGRSLVKWHQESEPALMSVILILCLCSYLSLLAGSGGTSEFNAWE